MRHTLFGFSTVTPIHTCFGHGKSPREGLQPHCALGQHLKCMVGCRLHDSKDRVNKVLRNAFVEEIAH